MCLYRAQWRAVLLAPARMMQVGLCLHCSVACGLTDSCTCDAGWFVSLQSSVACGLTGSCTCASRFPHIRRHPLLFTSYVLPFVILSMAILNRLGSGAGRVY
jgi:hypothetical protein